MPRRAPPASPAWCRTGIAYWAHAGDSRLYVITLRDGPASVAQTRDHSRVQRMVDEGSISDDEAVSHPLRNRVFSCLGGDAGAADRLLAQDAAAGRRHHRLVHRRRLGAAGRDAGAPRLGARRVMQAVPRLLDEAEQRGRPELRQPSADRHALGETTRRDTAMSNDHAARRAPRRWSSAQRRADQRTDRRGHRARHRRDPRRHPHNPQ